MGRKVYISSDMSTDDRLMEAADHAPMAPILWPWLLTAFDDWGRAEAVPRTIKAKVFPSFDAVTTEHVEGALNALASAGLIMLYEIGHKQYMAIPPEKWFRYQTQIPRCKRERDSSRIPAPDHSKNDHPSDIARDRADPSDIARDLVPSPSPSPSLSGMPDSGDAYASPPSSSTTGAEPPSPTRDAPPEDNLPAQDLVTVSDSAPGLYLVPGVIPPQDGLVQPQLIIRAWNTTCSDVMPKAKTLTQDRRSKIRSRCTADRGRDLNWWHAYFARIRSSPFCCGEMPSRDGRETWRADLDWAIRSEQVVARVLEGRYDARASPKSGPEYRNLDAAPGGDAGGDYRQDWDPFGRDAGQG